MRRALPEILPGASALALSTVLAVVLLSSDALDERLTINTPGGHFYIVTAASLVFVLPGSAAVIGALRGSSFRVLTLALGLISLAVIFTVHGLATPGFILDSRYFGVTGFSSRLAILVAASWLALSVARWPAALEARLFDRRGVIAAAWAGVLVAFTVLALVQPESLPPAITTAPVFLIGTTAAVITFSVVSAPVPPRLSAHPPTALRRRRCRVAAHPPGADRRPLWFGVGRHLLALPRPTPRRR